MQYSLLAETKRIYIRQDCFKLWAELEKNTNIFINGAPGTGKSTLAWHWCIYKASKERHYLNLTFLGCFYPLGSF